MNNQLRFTGFYYESMVGFKTGWDVVIMGALMGGEIMDLLWR
jgi:hypothetical protein